MSRIELSSDGPELFERDASCKRNDKILQLLKTLKNI